jgi:hypothetical protein
MAIDPFDEFEFKPLTEGLGFHKNSKAQTNSVNSTSTTGPTGTNFSTTSSITTSNDPSVRKTFPDIKKPRIEFAMNNSGTDIISEPMLPKAPPRPTTRTQTPATSTTVDDILKTLSERKKYDFTEDLKLTQKNEIILKPGHFELAAALLDGMLIVASFLTAMIILLVVTKVDLFGNLLSPDSGKMIYIGLAALFAGLCWTYLIVNRIFLGFTPGEWVFDQRVGNIEQLGMAGYSIRIAIRSTIVVATGLILFPLLSMVTRKDLIGKILGVQLMKKV